MATANDLDRRARDLHFESILVDGHADTLGRVLDKGEDLSKPTRGHIDVPKMRKGGLDAQFFACWIEPRHVAERSCARRTLQMIDALHRVKGVAIARTSSDIRRARDPAGVLCIEGGHAIENDLGVLRRFAELGVRYMTLTWNNSTDWADACAERPRHNGLTKLGREIVREMNRTGIMVDLSHVHEVTFWAAMATTRRPVIVSHSCARALCDHRRNLWDPQLRAVAKNNGVVCVNYYSAFISQEFKDACATFRDREEREDKAMRRAKRPERAIVRMHERYDRLSSRVPRPPLSVLLDHLDHIARVAGPDHVGLGSDFDGVSSLPREMDDCTMLPNITRGLLARGWSPRDVRNVLGENVLRVMKANE